MESVNGTSSFLQAENNLRSEQEQFSAKFYTVQEDNSDQAELEGSNLILQVGQRIYNFVIEI